MPSSWKLISTKSHILAVVLFATCAVLLSECTNPVEKTIVQAPVASAVDNVADSGVETRLRTALRSEPSLAGLDITAITTKGDVRLTAVARVRPKWIPPSGSRGPRKAHTPFTRVDD